MGSRLDDFKHINGISFIAETYLHLGYSITFQDCLLAIILRNPIAR